MVFVLFKEGCSFFVSRIYNCQCHLELPSIVEAAWLMSSLPTMMDRTVFRSRSMASITFDTLRCYRDVFISDIVLVQLGRHKRLSSQYMLSIATDSLGFRNMNVSINWEKNIHNIFKWRLTICIYSWDTFQTIKLCYWTLDFQEEFQEICLFTLIMYIVPSKFRYIFVDNWPVATKFRP